MHPTDQGFDRAFWEEHWRRAGSTGAGSMATSPPNPHLVREVSDLTPGTALDAGCGAGAEALWLADRGWRVTGADISCDALARAAERESAVGPAVPVQWAQADVAVWEPSTQLDLVTTHYAHSAMPQLDLYDRIAGWVAPGGTLLIVGHLHDHADPHSHGAESSVTAAQVAARLDDSLWDVVTAEERRRTLTGPNGHEVPLQDVVVRATRRT